MNPSAFFERLLRTLKKSRPNDRPTKKLHLECLQLESRLNPYNLSGNAWTSPNLITLSFAPDGTAVEANNNSTMFAAWNARFGTTSLWQNQILKAAQTWAVQTNINFTLVSDDGSAYGNGSYTEGDPNKGDIRFGGYNQTTGSLAYAYYPPPAYNNPFSGDIVFNTAQTWNIGSPYDVYSVALHEIGHALGLAHSNSTTAVMCATYSTTTNVQADDISGIRAIYGGNRSQDALDAAATNNNFATASNITLNINTTTKNLLIDRLDITNAVTDNDYFKFTVPAGMGGNTTIKAISSGRSLLAPKLTLYHANQTQIATVNGVGQYGTTLTINASLTANTSYFLKVNGADFTPFGTGVYALTMVFPGGSNVTLPSLNVHSPNSLPTATVSLSSAAPETADILTATATKTDADASDPVSLTYVWKVNGTTVRTYTSSSALTDTLDLSVSGNGDAGDTVSVTVTPNDGIASGAAVGDNATVAEGEGLLRMGQDLGLDLNVRLVKEAAIQVRFEEEIEVTDFSVLYSYDPERLKIKDVAPGSVLARKDVNITYEADETAGQLRINVETPAPITLPAGTQGSLFRIKLKGFVTEDELADLFDL